MALHQHVLPDGPGALRPSQAIRALALAAKGLVIIGLGTFSELEREQGGLDGARAWLLGLAAELGRPLAVNRPTLDGDMLTTWVAPPGWSPERVAAWAVDYGPAISAAARQVAAPETTPPAAPRPGRRR